MRSGHASEAQVHASYVSGSLGGEGQGREALLIDNGNGAHSRVLRGRPKAEAGRIGSGGRDDGTSSTRWFFWVKRKCIFIYSSASYMKSILDRSELPQVISVCSHCKHSPADEPTGTAVKPPFYLPLPPVEPRYTHHATNRRGLPNSWSKCSTIWGKINKVVRAIRLRVQQGAREVRWR